MLKKLSINDIIKLINKGKVLSTYKHDDGTIGYTILDNSIGVTPIVPSRDSASLYVNISDENVALLNQLGKTIVDVPLIKMQPSTHITKNIKDNNTENIAHKNNTINTNIANNNSSNDNNDNK